MEKGYTSQHSLKISKTRLLGFQTVVFLNTKHLIKLHN